MPESGAIAGMAYPFWLLLIMRAAVLAQVPGTLEVTELDMPDPAAGELLVKVVASSVNGSPRRQPAPSRRP
jgi:hypothetical protein